jgi:hypothetical protein
MLLPEHGAPSAAWALALSPALVSSEMVAASAIKPGRKEARMVVSP